MQHGNIMGKAKGCCFGLGFRLGFGFCLGLGFGLWDAPAEKGISEERQSPYSSRAKQCKQLPSKFIKKCEENAEK